jgi:2-polyprenyl-3-methyl-5-hydroxy-6-metoxy-1,4-benzoquinol methylase
MLLSILLPEEGRILDVGCGFGLFSSYFSLVCARRQVTGVDPNARRIAIAREVAQKLGLRENRYLQGIVGSVPLDGLYDGIVMLDVLHHVPREAQLPLLETLRSLLAPGGVLVLKDITTDAPLKLKFTELLDRIMAGWNEPLAYRHHAEWVSILRTMGFKVRVVRVPDVLPYPHVVMVARL